METESCRGRVILAEACAWCAQGTVRRPAWLEVEGKGQGPEGRVEVRGGGQWTGPQRPQ